MDALWWQACISGLLPRFINFFILFSQLNIFSILNIISDIHHPSPSSWIHPASNQLPITLLPHLCHMLGPGSPTLFTKTAKFADFFTWQTQLTLFFKNRNIFDSRQQCLWIDQNIMALKGSYTVQRGNRPKRNYYRDGVFANTTKLSNFLSFLWHCKCQGQGWQRGKGENRNCSSVSNLILWHPETTAPISFLGYLLPSKKRIYFYANLFDREGKGWEGKHQVNQNQAFPVFLNSDKSNEINSGVSERQSGI